MARMARYHAGVPYLAQAPVDSLANPTTWRFFIGRTQGGQPQWVTHGEWMRGAALPEASAPHRWRPPGEAEIFVPATPAGRCVAEFSVTWNRPLGMWLMLNQCLTIISITPGATFIEAPLLLAPLVAHGVGLQPLWMIK
jgi:hypothetical protein